MPWPIEPPVSVSQSCGGQPAVAPGREQSAGLRLVGDDRALGQQRAERALRRPSAVSVARRRVRDGRPAATRCRRHRHRARRRGARARRATSSPPSASVCTSQSVGHEQARLVGIGEERHRRRACRRARGAARRRAAPARTRRSSRAVRRRAARAPLEPGREHLAEQLRARRLRDAARGDAAPRSRNAAPPSSNAAGSPDRSALATRVDRVARDLPARGDRAARPPARRLRATSCRRGG